jgi:DNA-binding MltR family transcriptional regulator
LQAIKYRNTFLTMKDENNIIKGTELDRYFELNENLIIFHNQFNYEDNDRAIVIVGLAFIEDLLLNILESFFPNNSKTVEKLIGFTGALGTVNSKINMIYSLGFIDKVIKQDLEKVVQIRNKFAHKTNMSFEDVSVEKLCKELKWHETAMMWKTPEIATAKQIFKVNINTLVSHLRGTASIAKGEKRKLKNSYE